jgi:hypothetical protein
VDVVRERGADHGRGGDREGRSPSMS